MLFLACFKRGDMQRVMATAIPAAKHRTILKHIHLTKTDRGPMGRDTGIQQHIPCCSRIAIMAVNLSLSRGISRHHCADMQIMS